MRLLQRSFPLFCALILALSLAACGQAESLILHHMLIHVVGYVSPSGDGDI